MERILHFILEILEIFGLIWCFWQIGSLKRTIQHGIQILQR